MAARIAPKLLIFSDLDGTFLDHHSYKFGEALPAFQDCLSAGVPVIFCSSKTRSEMEPLLPVALHVAFDGYGVVQLGTSYRALTSTLATLSRDLRIPIRAFHQMTPWQIAAEAGLPDWKAELARAREYDEPFTFSNAAEPDVDRFLKAVELLGLRWTKGGRFHLGHAGKRSAVSILTSLYRRWNPEVLIAGLGDSANDTGMLATVDIAILVQKPNGQYDPAVAHALPSVHRSSLPGPRGWTVSARHLLAALDGLRPQRCRSQFLADCKEASLI